MSKKAATPTYGNQDPLVRKAQIELIACGSGSEFSGKSAVGLTRELFKLCANEGRFDLWEYAVVFLRPAMIAMIAGVTAKEAPRVAAIAYTNAKETIRYDFAYGQED